MNTKDKQQLKLEIAHIFDSGANEIRVFEMVKNFIQKRYESTDSLLIPADAHSFEVFAIKDSTDSPTGKQAFIGFKLKNNNFHFIGVPFTEKEEKGHY